MPQVPTLYHGTDARFVRLTEQERFAYKDACLVVLDYLWPFYEPYDFGGCRSKELPSILNYDQNPEQWKKITTALRFIRGMKSGHSQYQYQKDCLYLTCDKDTAEFFAHQAFAGGELGRMVFDLLQAVPLMQFNEWNPLDSISQAIGQIDAFATASPEPIVFEFDNLDVAFMLTDTNQPVHIHDNELINQTVFRVVRYIKPISLNLQDAIWVNSQD